VDQTELIITRLLPGPRRESRKCVSMKIRASSNPGFTLVEIMIVVAIIGLLAAIAIPNFVRARGTTQTNACINNLRQIDGAAQLWALEFSKAPNNTYQLEDIVPYLRPLTDALPRCPAGGDYTPGLTVSNPPTCSLSAEGHAME